MKKLDKVTAAILLIGDELLSGRTKDANFVWLAGQLTANGIDVAGARIVPDVEDEIVQALNALRAKCDYVFTTGGIGPTHDDITADAVARAFGVPISHDPDASALLKAYFAERGRTANAARMRMARLPHGAVMIPNPVSIAPGFQIENVFVMAGVPQIMRVMFENVLPQLKKASPLQSVSVRLRIGEGDLAAPLEKIQNAFPDVSIGSYPFQEEGRFGSNIVLRARDADRLNAAAEQVRTMAGELQAAAF